MKIEHIAIWTEQLEVMKDFYCKFFKGKANGGYHNPKKGFRSYFLTFDSGARLELMSSVNIMENKNIPPAKGYAHMAFTAGKRQDVDCLTERIKSLGYKVVSGSRVTGDGYYESVIEDPDGNLVEICAEE